MIIMTHYGRSLDCDDPWISGCLELSIETLTGTAFELRVLPTDTIMSIKTKIQRVEGIPVAQQHLLYQSQELNNSSAVRDYAITNGSTLKLVLSMRGGPISNRRVPSMDDVAWRELQDLMKESSKDDALATGSKVTVLVFRDGDQVNLFRVIENDDGTYSPLSDSWSGTSIRNLFAEEDFEECNRRLEENSVTMSKMQELKDKLETLSLQRKDKKSGEHKSEELKPECEAACSSSYSLPSIPKPTPCTPSRPSLSKARKDAQNIIRMQSKALNVVVPTSLDQLKKAPLPDICRSKTEPKESMRDKTSRLTTPSFAIFEEDESSAPESSMMAAMQGNEEIAVAYSPVPRSSTVSRSSYRVSRYLLSNDERPKSTPGQRQQTTRQLCDILTETEGQGRERTRHILSTFSNLDILQDLPQPSKDTKTFLNMERVSFYQKKSSSTQHPSYKNLPAPLPVPTPPIVNKKKIRCLQCKKRLNITNTHTCRCGNVYCALHRYSEVHNCPFDYKEEGRKLLQQANPLVAASKLPKI